MHEEVNMDPEGVGEDDFGEFGVGVASTLGRRGAWGLFGEGVRRKKFAEELEVGRVGPFGELGGTARVP